jgi:hypothetical protein
MTATAERNTHEQRGVEGTPRHAQPSQGSLDDLLSSPLKHVDVELHGKTHRLQELSQGFVEDIAVSVLNVAEHDGEEVSQQSALRGYKARSIACALIYPDGRPYFEKPLEQWPILNEKLSPTDIDALFDALNKLSPVSKKARDEMGKDSEPGAKNDGGQKSP